MLALLPWLALRPAGAEEPAQALARAVRRAADRSAPVQARQAAADEALALGLDAEGEGFAAASASLLAHDEARAVRLLVRARRAGAGPALDDLRRALAARPAAETPAARARRAALALLLGLPVQASDLATPWPPEPDVAEALALRLGASLLEGTPDAVRARLGPALEARGWLDGAGSPDEATSRAALEQLVAAPESSLPLALALGRSAVAGAPPGLLAEAMDVLAVLGAMGRREATAVLVAGLESMQGWVRHQACAALADLRDPAAAVALARQVAYAGDPFRARESWDYPGTTDTPIPPEAWPTVEYYAIDVAACDALLALGARGAAGWLVRNALDPTRRNLRIRVPQDAIDVLRRHLPSAPLPEVLVEGSLPDRWAAWQALEAWWRQHRDEPQLLAVRFPGEDAGWQAQAARLARRLVEPKVLELMIAKDSCELLGAAMTPALVAALDGARPGARTELARALARTRDPAAGPALRSLLGAPQGFVRAAAAEVLDVLARQDPAVVDDLLRLLDDADCGVRVAAMKGLVGAPVEPRVLEAVRAHDEAPHPQRCGADAAFGWARSAVLLVQDGMGNAPALLEGCGHADRVVRRTAWDLLRAALDLPEYLFDPLPPPGGPDWRGPERSALEAALAARRGR
ncbi:MAG: HEAT repeat domain-containing protein [Planctomycetia bacterium]